MNPSELLARCEKQIALVGEDGAEVLLRVPGRWGKTNTRRMVKGDRTSPVGEIVEDNIEGRGLRVMFKAVEVRDYIRRMWRKS